MFSFVAGLIIAATTPYPCKTTLALQVIAVRENEACKPNGYGRKCARLRRMDMDTWKQHDAPRQLFCLTTAQMNTLTLDQHITEYVTKTCDPTADDATDRCAAVLVFFFRQDPHHHAVLRRFLHDRVEDAWGDDVVGGLWINHERIDYVITPLPRTWQLDDGRHHYRFRFR